jgi:hypothetical protein
MRRSTAFFTATVLTVGLAAAFAGVAAAGEQLTKKEFLNEGNAICKAANKEINAVFEEVFAGVDENTQPSPDVQAAAAAGAIPIFRGALGEIEALEGPASLEKKVDKGLDQYNTVVDGIEADPQSAFGGGPDPFVKADKLAVKVGLKQCTQGG